MVARVFLVADHEIVRRGVADVVDAEPDLQTSGEAATIAEALVRIPPSRSDVVIADVRLPDGDGVVLYRELKPRSTLPRFLMLTPDAGDEALFEAIMAGVSGFVLEQALGSDLLAAIRTVVSGQSLLDPNAKALIDRERRRNAQRDPIKALTQQERVVLEHIGQGLTNRQIATRMCLAEKTVKNYVSHVLAKLGMRSRTQAALLAMRGRDHARHPPV